MSKGKNTHLDARAQKVLREIITRYLQDGNPVGSRTLANAGGIRYSAATIRNVMSDMEDIGFLISPHTSAGRVPSARGIRFFIDRLLTVTPPPRRVVRQMRDGLRGDTAAGAQRTAAEIISQLTRHVGFVVTPAAEAPVVRQLRFVKLSPGRVLAVIVTAGGDVLNRVFVYDGGGGISEGDLNAAAAAYNRHFSGMTFDNAKTLLQSQMLDLRQQISALLRALLKRVETDGEAAAGAIQIAGESNLLNENELSGDVRRLRELYALLARKKELLTLIKSGGEAENARVFIGSEAGLSALDECSVVFASCRGGETRAVGIVGVIGPKRMRYNQVIPTVDMAAKMLGEILRDLRLPA